VGYVLLPTQTLPLRRLVPQLLLVGVLT